MASTDAFQCCRRMHGAGIGSHVRMDRFKTVMPPPTQVALSWRPATGRFPVFHTLACLQLASMLGDIHQAIQRRDRISKLMKARVVVAIYIDQDRCPARDAPTKVTIALDDPEFLVAGPAAVSIAALVSQCPLSERALLQRHVDDGKREFCSGHPAVL